MTNRHARATLQPRSLTLGLTALVVLVTACDDGGATRGDDVASDLVADTAADGTGSLPDAITTDAADDVPGDGSDASMLDGAFDTSAVDVTDMPGDSDVADVVDDPFEAPDRILFIGNSFTFGGPVPTIVDDLANDAGWPDPEVDYVAFGGESLTGHFEDRPETLAAVDEGDWDVVVLQEFSTGPTDANIGNPDAFKSAATRFHDRIKATSPDARIILYETWARHPDHGYFPGTYDDPADMQAQLRFHYNDAAQSYIPANAIEPVSPPVVVAPAGDAWEYHLAQSDAVRLHADDDWHAGRNGQYLNGLVIYATIYQRSVEGLTPRNVSAAAALVLQRDADATTGLTTPGGPDGTGREPGLVPGQRVFVDFGDPAATGAGWTTLTDAIDGAVLNLVAADGAETDVDVVITDGFGGTNGVGMPSNDLGWPTAASGDSFFCGSFDTHADGLTRPGQVTLRGLEPGARYDLRAFASRQGDDGGTGRLTRFAATGADATLTVDVDVASNTGSTADFLGVAADEFGRIVLDVAVSPEGASRFCYLGALELTGR